MSAKVEFLFNEKSVAHIWYEDKLDTACRMWSTGGMRWAPKKKKREFKVSDDRRGRSICQLCNFVQGKRTGEPIPNLSADLELVAAARNAGL